MPLLASSPDLKVLVVDDDPDAAESLSFCLQLDGRTVRCATSGQEALALAESFTPDVALIDLFMPRLDGYMLAQALRRRFGPDMLLIAVTGAIRSVEPGDFDFHLTKPVDFNQLQRLFSLAPGVRQAS
jgi:CheY-like chemotaxis protein